MTDGKKIYSIRRQKEKNSQQGKRFFVFACAVIFIVFLILVYENFFNIKKINVTGSFGEEFSYEEILDVSGVETGDNLFRVDKSEVEENLLLSYSYIDKVTVSKKFPATLVIDVQVHTPAMLVELGEDAFLLAHDTKVLQVLSEGEEVPAGVCKIETNGIDECIQGKLVKFENEEEAEILIEIYKAFADAGIAERLTYLDTRNKFDIDAVVEGRFKIIFGSNEGKEAKAELLSQVLTGDIWTDASGIIDVSDSREATVRLTGSAAN